MLLDSPRAHLEVLKTAGVGPLTVRVVPPTLEGKNGGGDDDDADGVEASWESIGGLLRLPEGASWEPLGASWEPPGAS